MDHLLVLSRANERQPSRGKQYKSLEMLPNSGSETVFPGEAAGTPSTEPFKNKQVLSVLLGPCLPTSTSDQAELYVQYDPSTLCFTAR